MGGGVLENIPSMGKVWMFSGTTHYDIKLEKLEQQSQTWNQTLSFALL